MNEPFFIGDSIVKYKKVLCEIWDKNPENITLLDPCFLKCVINGNVILVFNIIIGKLAKLSYFSSYDKEVIEGIKLGMSIKSISDNYVLEYDDDENFYSLVAENNIALFFENPYLSISENPENKLEEITIYDSSLLNY